MAKSKGLGDTVEKITKITGIKIIVDAITDDCNCEANKNWLNGKVPYDGKKRAKNIKNV
jgi:hypothetical protein